MCHGGCQACHNKKNPPPHHPDGKSQACHDRPHPTLPHWASTGHNGSMSRQHDNMDMLQEPGLWQNQACWDRKTLCSDQGKHSTTAGPRVQCLQKHALMRKAFFYLASLKVICFYLYFNTTSKHRSICKYMLWKTYETLSWKHFRC